MRERGETAARACAAAGIAGPVVFTSAWIASSLLQTGHSAAQVQISGLAAPDARDPWIMITGFLLLGGCGVAFGEALHRALGRTLGGTLGGSLRRALGRTLGGTLGGRGAAVRGRAGPAPRLIQGAGVLSVAAGLLRRDHMLLTSGPVSWHNHAHDIISAVIYVDLVLAQVLLAVRFGRDPRWRPWRGWLLASATASAAVLIAFAADTSSASAGILQRIAVTIPLAAIAAIAARLFSSPAAATPPATAPGSDCCL